MPTLAGVHMWLLLNTYMQILKPGEESKAMLEALRSDPRAARQFVLMAHLYSRTDSASLAQIRRALLAPRYTPAQVWNSLEKWPLCSG
jgi:Tfp pilus assembly protein PilF